MSNAVSKIRAIFSDHDGQMTLADIRNALPELKSNQVSMALCYFIRQRYMTREQISNVQTSGRKKVWLYTFHKVRLPPTTV
jgi:hypothetical protein